MLLAPALKNRHELLCDRTELVSAIKRVRINADHETSAIVLRLGDDEISVESQDKLGNASTEIVTASWKSDSRVLVVNHKFLMDMLDMYDGKSCKFRLGDDTKTRKSTILLEDVETGTVGIIQQMRQEWTTEIV
jgi:DNA polymerase III sliding clamp (beta) subunit (PCNA family)